MSSSCGLLCPLLPHPTGLLEAVPEGTLMLLLSCWDQEGKTRAVPQTISVTVTAPLVSSGQTRCDGTFSVSRDAGLTMPPVLQAASIQQSSAAQASLFFLMVNY